MFSNEIVKMIAQLLNILKTCKLHTWKINFMLCGFYFNFLKWTVLKGKISGIYYHDMIEKQVILQDFDLDNGK